MLDVAAIRTGTRFAPSLSPRGERNNVTAPSGRRRFSLSPRGRGCPKGGRGGPPRPRRCNAHAPHRKRRACRKKPQPRHSERHARHKKRHSPRTEWHAPHSKRHARPKKRRARPKAAASTPLRAACTPQKAASTSLEVACTALEAARTPQKAACTPLSAARTAFPRRLLPWRWPWVRGVPVLPPFRRGGEQNNLTSSSGRRCSFPSPLVGEGARRAGEGA